jgi:hypothetical protein
MQTSERVRLGLPNISQEFTAIRERWAMLTNEALKEANIEARVDHRSLAAQGIDREPTPHIPFAAYKIERAGKHSEVAEAIRADYNARVQVRLDRAAEQTSSVAAAAAERATPAVAETAPTAVRAVTTNLEDVRREARENWLRMRAEQSANATATPSDANTRNAAASASNPAVQATNPALQASNPAARPDTPASPTRNATTRPHTPARDDDYQP